MNNLIEYWRVEWDGLRLEASSYAHEQLSEPDWNEMMEIYRHHTGTNKTELHRGIEGRKHYYRGGGVSGKVLEAEASTLEGDKWIVRITARRCTCRRS